LGFWNDIRDVENAKNRMGGLCGLCMMLTFVFSEITDHPAVIIAILAWQRCRRANGKCFLVYGDEGLAEVEGSIAGTFLRMDVCERGVVGFAPPGHEADPVPMFLD
jgi:hypothetical protein